MPAIVLLAHGSPDPAWIRPIERTAARLRELAPEHPVAVATLDEGSFATAVLELLAAGERDVRVVAYFMSPGGRHLRRDIPALVAVAQESHPEATITLIPGALGVADEVLDALARAALRLGGGDLPEASD
jgi:sirohydrochlorin cobaltochelatase